MALWRFAVIFTVLGTLSVLALPTKNDSEDPLVANYYSLPDDEKENFLGYFMALGVMHKSMISYPGTKAIGNAGKKTVKGPLGLNITQTQISKFQDMNIPDSSISKFVDWTKKRFTLEDSDVATLARRRVVCNSDGVCVTVPDVGSLCCPW